MSNKEVILAFSGGLDTSFCIPYLKDKGYDVVTLFVDTGGADAEEQAYIRTRATELGAKEHVHADGAQSIWDEVVVPLVHAGGRYQEQYPLLCSDRYIIVRRSLELARKRGTTLFAHGCTGMGNDQVRFDQTVRSLGSDFTILAPIRDIQQQHKNVREYEQEYLKSRGFAVRPKTTRYSINANVLGVTSSGSEIDLFEAPGDETYVMTAHPRTWPREAHRVTLGFEKGTPVSLDGKRVDGPRMLQELNARLGKYGVGRHIYTGDTTIGLKGRIVFESPGIEALLHAHRALEETVLTRDQNAFKGTLSQKWVELVYKGFFHEPLKYDVEAAMASMQRFVTGSVTLETWGGTVHAVALQSDHMLKNSKAVYAQSADWGAQDAEGFIKLFGQSSTLSARINPLVKL
jgi:argininosuccinate synthase